MNRCYRLWFLCFALFIGTGAINWYSVTKCTCPEGSIPFDIYNTINHAGVFVTKCIEGSFAPLVPTSIPIGDEAYACYATCPEPCTIPKVTCFELATMGDKKPGKCPTHDDQTDPETYQKNMCIMDRECKAQKKCCLLQPSNKWRCVNPVEIGRQKCGECATVPFLERVISPDYYDSICTKDDQCSGTNRCCPFYSLLGLFYKCYKTREDGDFSITEAHESYATHNIV